MNNFEQLYDIIQQRATERPEGSSTVAELDRGVHGIGKKIVEEAAEVWMACEYETDDEACLEMAQLIYHLQVMMVAKGFKPEDIYRHM